MTATHDPGERAKSNFVCTPLPDFLPAVRRDGLIHWRLLGAPLEFSRWRRWWDAGLVVVAGFLSIGHDVSSLMIMRIASVANAPAPIMISW